MVSIFRSIRPPLTTRCILLPSVLLYPARQNLSMVAENLKDIFRPDYSATHRNSSELRTEDKTNRRFSHRVLLSTPFHNQSVPQSFSVCVCFSLLLLYRQIKKKKPEAIAPGFQSCNSSSHNTRTHTHTQTYTTHSGRCLAARPVPEATSRSAERSRTKNKRRRLVACAQWGQL